MLKIVLLAYSQGLISSRVIERACARNIQFIAISGDNQPSHAHIAKFVTHLSEQIKPLFSQVLMTCDAMGLIGREMFAIDGVKLPSNASKERSGTRADLLTPSTFSLPACTCGRVASMPFISTWVWPATVSPMACAPPL